MRDKDTKQCPQTTTFLKENRSGIEPRPSGQLLLTSLKPHRLAKPAQHWGVPLCWDLLQSYEYIPDPLATTFAILRHTVVSIAQLTRSLESTHPLLYARKCADGQSVTTNPVIYSAPQSVWVMGTSERAWGNKSLVICMRVYLNLVDSSRVINMKRHSGRSSTGRSMQSRC